mmetsp:Transcript_14875/g.33207  ORF Transcript_14875/g.33207 Transcript_14875/m.33207 type:complete len:851 (-) Transcript_14875:59-2611(-)
MQFLTGGGGASTSTEAPPTSSRPASDDDAQAETTTGSNISKDYFPIETYRKLGTDAARAIGLVNKLKSAGAEYDLELPRLVFAGKQSAGKSSIVKALTSVQLPRNYGTCTRCPIEVTTKNSPGQEWSCRISLRITVDEESGGQYSPPVIEECCVITDSNSMPDEIENAQRALLERVTNGTNFTSNVVCVNIAGDGCPDLSLVDLPGLIQSTESKDDEGDIQRVEELVKSYLASSETVILQCIACDEDIENQSIRKLARDFDPEGKRSIGVLTKPDKVDLGTEAGIISILQGEKYALAAQGYFVVRTPKQDELNKLKETGANVTAFEEARAIENDFFQYHEVGKHFYQNAPERCGSAKLLYKLSSMLQILIDEHTPVIKVKAEEALAQTETELEGLGVEMKEADARMELIELARRISLNSTEAIKSTTRDKSFWRRTVEIFENINKQVCDTSPMFQIGDKVVFSSLLNLDVKSSGYLRESLTMHISQDEFEAIVEEAHSNELILSPVQSIGGIDWQLQVGQESGSLAVRANALKLPPDIASVGVILEFNTRGLTLHKGEATKTEATLVAGCPSQPKLFSWPYNGNSFFIGVSIKILSYTPSEVNDRAYDVGEVKEMLENTSGRDFPGIRLSSSAVCQELIGETVELWKDPAYASSKTIHNLLRYHLLGDSPQSAINQFVHPRYKKLKRAVFSIITKHVNKLEDESIQQIAKLVEMEKPPFFTLNDFFLLDSRSKFQEVVESLDMNRICDDEVTEVIVSTLSFIRVKQKIFTENVIQYLLHHCLGTFEVECEKVLLDGLGLTGAKRRDDSELLRLFHEEDDIYFRRKDLKERRLRQKVAVDLITEHLEEFEY